MRNLEHKANILWKQPAPVYKEYCTESFYFCIISNHRRHSTMLTLT